MDSAPDSGADISAPFDAGERPQGRDAAEDSAGSVQDTGADISVDIGYRDAKPDDAFVDAPDVQVDAAGCQLLTGSNGGAGDTSCCASNVPLYGCVCGSEALRETCNVLNPGAIAEGANCATIQAAYAHGPCGG